MTIEFLDPDEQTVAAHVPAETIGGEGPHRRRLEIDWEPYAAVILLAGAAVLAVLAPFQTVSTQTQRRGSTTIGASVDGWGRWHTLGTASVAAGSHDARYGIPLCVCAAAFALGALLGAAALRGRNPRTVTAAALASVCGLCGMAGVTATMWLEIDAMFDTFHATTNGADDLPDAFGGFHLGVGAAIWLAFAGVVAAFLGTYACLRLRARWNQVPPTVTAGVGLTG